MSDQKPLAVGVVGLGFGANHARVLSRLQGVRLAAVCDTHEERLSDVARTYGSGAYKRYETMLQDEELDAVVVATPARLHEPVAQAAIAAGCAVLVEKPLAPTLAEGLRLAKAAAAAGVLLMPGHIERFNPALRALRERVLAGEIGRVVQLSARRTGAIRVPPADVNAAHDSALHDIDAMRFVLDGAECEQAFAGAQTGLVTPLENAIAGILRFEPAGGLAPVGILEVNWLSPRRLRDLSVLGENGLLVLDYAAQTLERFAAPESRSGPVVGWSLSRPGSAGLGASISIEPREQLVLELQGFVDAVRGRAPLEVTCEDALAALSIADALTTSARTGKSLRPQGWSLLD